MRLVSSSRFTFHSFSMSGNTFGKVFRLITFGESHSPATGGVVEGCPAGVNIDISFINSEMNRRKPVYTGSTSRKENDEIEFLSGIKDEVTIGTPIGFVIRNADVKPVDYQNISDVFRPSHADFSYFKKYGQIITGGGRASGRETAARVVGGAIAKLFLKEYGIVIKAFVSQIGELLSDEDHFDVFESLINDAERRGDTLGGTVSCSITGVPAGLGEPVFDKLNADLAKAMMSIGSAKAFEYGLGFKASEMKGSVYNDQLTGKEGKVVFLTNHDGGIQGGISNGEEINFRVGFKPVPSVRMAQSSVDIDGNPAEISISGRHDTCHVPRLAVVVESMAALVLADHLLRNRSARVIF